MQNVIKILFWATLVLQNVKNVENIKTRDKNKNCKTFWAYTLEHSNSGKKVSIRFDSILATESIFSIRFDSPIW